MEPAHSTGSKIKPSKENINPSVTVQDHDAAATSSEPPRQQGVASGDLSVNTNTRREPIQVSAPKDATSGSGTAPHAVSHTLTKQISPPKAMGAAIAGTLDTLQISATEGRQNSTGGSGSSRSPSAQIEQPDSPSSIHRRGSGKKKRMDSGMSEDNARLIKDRRESDNGQVLVDTSEEESSDEESEFADDIDRGRDLQRQVSKEQVPRDLEPSKLKVDEADAKGDSSGKPIHKLDKSELFHTLLGCITGGDELGYDNLSYANCLLHRFATYSARAIFFGYFADAH